MCHSPIQHEMHTKSYLVPKPYHIDESSNLSDIITLAPRSARLAQPSERPRSTLCVLCRYLLFIAGFFITFKIVQLQKHLVLSVADSNFLLFSLCDCMQLLFSFIVSLSLSRHVLLTSFRRCWLLSKFLFVSLKFILKRFYEQWNLSIKKQ